MIENRLQHYLPACYLKYFTVERNREGALWAHNSKTGKWRRTTPHAECKSAWFYAKELPTDRDPFARLFERPYSGYVTRALSGSRMTTEEQWMLFAIMAQIYLRNPSMRHLDEVERLERFEANFDTLMSQLIDVSLPFDLRGILRAFSRQWEVRCLTVTRGKILTSDNPTAIHGPVPDRRQLVAADARLLSLPITPRHFLIAASLRHFRFVNNSMDVEDQKYFQGASYGQRLRFTYFDEAGDVPGVVKHQIEEVTRPQTNASGFALSFTRMTRTPSFLRKV